MKWVAVSDPVPIRSIPVISEDDAREALLEYIGQRCCYGKAAARDFVFANINPSSAFHVSPAVKHSQCVCLTFTVQFHILCTYVWKCTHLYWQNVQNEMECACSALHENGCLDYSWAVFWAKVLVTSIWCASHCKLYSLMEYADVNERFKFHTISQCSLLVLLFYSDFLCQQ